MIINGIKWIVGEYEKVIGNSEKRDIASHLLRNDNNLVSDIMTNKDPLNSLSAGYKNKTRAFVEIQNGCNHRCTFCVIPYGRGNLRSKPKEQIIIEINDLISKGHKEIILRKREKIWILIFQPS